MGTASFLELAQAVRETHTLEMQTIARLVGVADADELALMRARKVRLLETADLLVDMSPHEPLVRSIVRVGGLADLPEYSPDLSQLRPGVTGLWRGEVRDVMPVECEVAFKALRLTTHAWISRANLIGLERTPPSMWLPAR